jgi:hypothetical protein
LENNFSTERGVMVTTPEDLRSKTDDEIFDSMHGAMFDSDHYKHCVTHLQLRYMHRTLQATTPLVIATYALVVATLFLLAGSILSLLFRNTN